MQMYLSIFPWELSHYKKVWVLLPRLIELSGRGSLAFPSTMLTLVFRGKTCIPFFWWVQTGVTMGVTTWVIGAHLTTRMTCITDNICKVFAMWFINRYRFRTLTADYQTIVNQIWHDGFELRFTQLAHVWHIAQFVLNALGEHVMIADGSFQIDCISVNPCGRRIFLHIGIRFVSGDHFVTICLIFGHIMVYGTPSYKPYAINRIIIAIDRLLLSFNW